jgi:hypothetical protein
VGGREGEPAESEPEPEAWLGRREPGVEGGRESVAPAGRESVQAGPGSVQADREPEQGKPVQAGPESVQADPELVQGKPVQADPEEGRADRKGGEPDREVWPAGHISENLGQ